MLNERAGTIMIADDERHLRESLGELFSGAGYVVMKAADGDQVIKLLECAEEPPETIFLDLRMPGRDGPETLRWLKQQPSHQHIPVVIVTAFGGSELTIEAMKAGAYDYITKPFDPDEVLQTAARAIETSRLNRKLRELRTRLPADEGSQNKIVGDHPTMRDLFKLIGRVAPTDATVLITGESGTGKEMVAQAIHRHGMRSAGPLVTVNCAAIPHELVESELFGYERGAFTGAVTSKPGRLESADSGTLFLDEVGDLPLEAQAKLLRALQERSVERLGGKNVLRADFRLITATNQDLAAAVAARRFREDLYYRLNVVNIKMPPLRARRSDIPILAEYFLRCAGAGRSNPPIGFSEDALRLLAGYDYPGNVRELKNIVERAVVLADGPLVTVEDLPDLAKPAHEQGELSAFLEMPLEQAVFRLERMMIRNALARAHGNKAEAARILGIHRQQLYSKLKELEID